MDDGGRGGLSVLFVHGNGGNRTQWAAQLEHLRVVRRAAAFDLRGMGESEPAGNADYSVQGFAEDVAAVADALGFDRFVLVGHSFGGAVITSYAGKHPDRLAGLVFADVAGDIRNPPAAQAEALRRGFEPDNYEDFTRRWFEAILVKATGATKAAVMKSLRATPRKVFIAASNRPLQFRPGRRPGPLPRPAPPYRLLPRGQPAGDPPHVPRHARARDPGRQSLAHAGPPGGVQPPPRRVSEEAGLIGAARTRRHRLSAAELPAKSCV